MPPGTISADAIAALAPLACARDVSEFWDATLALIRAAAPFDTAFLWYDYYDFANSSQSTLVLESPWRERDPDYWHARRANHPTPQFLKDHPGAPLHRVSDALSAEALPRSAFYSRFMQPEGWEFGITLSFWQRQEVRANIVIYRTAAQGDFSAEEEAWLRALHPLIRSVLFRLIHEQQQRALHASLSNFVAGLPIGVMLVNWNLQPVFVNDEGCKQAFFWVHGAARPYTVLPRKTLQVPPDLAAACEVLRRRWLETDEHGDAPVEHTVPSKHSDLYAVVRAQQVHGVSAHRPSFLIRFGGLGSRAHDAFQPSDEQLKILSQLTPAERKVAILLVRGLSNREIAERLHRERCTVKDHLSHIYGKLGVRNRTQLTSLLSR
ncbi:MAG: LuxR C-terminal-related transcriptional regulator [Rhizomicrobium sp.]